MADSGPTHARVDLKRGQSLHIPPEVSRGTEGGRDRPLCRRWHFGGGFTFSFRFPPPPPFKVDKAVIGCGWETRRNVAVDLDFTTMLFDADGNFLNVVDFSRREGEPDLVMTPWTDFLL